MVKIMGKVVVRALVVTVNSAMILVTVVTEQYHEHDDDLVEDLGDDHSDDHADDNHAESEIAKTFRIARFSPQKLSG